MGRKEEKARWSRSPLLFWQVQEARQVMGVPAGGRNLPLWRDLEGIFNRDSATTNSHPLKQRVWGNSGWRKLVGAGQEKERKAPGKVPGDQVRSWSKACSASALALIADQPFFFFFSPVISLKSKKDRTEEGNAECLWSL